MRFRKKPIEIEAFQMTKEHRWDNSEWPEWLHRAWNLRERTCCAVYPNPNDPTKETLHIWTYEGPMVCQIGDWIIKGFASELYPCKPDIFEATYEKVKGDAREEAG